MCEKCEGRYHREEERWRQMVKESGEDHLTAPESLPPFPSPRDFNCQHQEAPSECEEEEDIERGEYETTTPLHMMQPGGTVVNISGLRQVTFDGDSLRVPR